MIPEECKRLAEVDFPIAEVSKHSAREKSIRHGHPSTLHLWWARRPLAACRAMLLELLLPDPCDENCPKDFKKKARDLLPRLIGKVGPKDEDLRKSLLKFIADFANWDNSSHPTFLEVGRGLVKGAHGEETPLVVDPFAGGGSIPLEALRLGCDAFASDLNPVACLILKVMLEDIPRHGPELAEELRRVGKEIKEKAEKELGEFYPKDKDGATPIAYLWARTVKCESPNCGAEIPLMRSFWLCKKANRKRALRYKIVRFKGEELRVEFEIFEPKADKEVSGGTVTRAKARCLCCNMVLPLERVRAQLSEQRGGADAIFDAKGNRTDGTRLLAVVTVRPGTQGKDLRLPSSRDYEAIWKTQRRLEDDTKRTLPSGLSLVPDEEIPITEIRRISVPLYGCTTWADVFTQRQKLALSILSTKARAVSDGATSPNGKAIADLIALSVSKQTERSSSFVSWITQTQAPRGTFARQALGFVWDFAEVVPICGDQEYLKLIAAMAEVAKRLSVIDRHGQVESSDACNPPLPDKSVQVWFTDPPYYDSVPYAHLSDFFYVWLRRILHHDKRLGFAEVLVPKDQECVVDRPHRLNPTAKMIREDQPWFPPRATREALANALCHRDYTIPGGAVAVAMYDDHLEITNPGALQFGITPEKLTKPHESKPWNPIIANVFYRAGIIERWGAGTLNMIDWCAENGNPAPAWQEQAGSVYVTFLPAALPDTPEVTPEVRKMLTVIQGEMSRTEIQQKLGLTDEKHFRENYQQPAVAMELIEMTIPDKPRSSKQKYRLTGKGRAVVKDEGGKWRDE